MTDKVTLISQSKKIKANHVFKNYYYKFSEEEQRDIYIIRIISRVTIKLTNYIRTFKIRELATELLINKAPIVLNKKLTYNNSIIYITNDIRQGINFPPDLNLLQESLKFDQELEQKYDVFFGGSVGILDKSQKRAVQLAQGMGDYYYTLKNTGVAFSFNEAIETIDSFRIADLPKMKNSST